MKKSFLSFGAIPLLLFFFACSPDQEPNPGLKSEVPLKGEINTDTRLVHTTEGFAVQDLIASLHGYGKAKVTEELDYLQSIPERKSPDWFHKHFDFQLDDDDEINEWIREKVDSEELLVFGTTIHKIQVANLVFTDGLVVPEAFEGKSGILLDTDWQEECIIWSSWGEEGSNSCHCFMFMGCYYEFCWHCHEPDGFVNIMDLISPDLWSEDFELLAEIPVHHIELGEPVLQ